MDRLHDAEEGAEGQLRDAGEARLHADGEGAELQRDDAAEQGGKDDRRAGSTFSAHAGKQVRAHDGTPDQVIPDEAAVERHVPDVRAEGK